MRNPYLPQQLKPLYIPYTHNQCQNHTKNDTKPSNPEQSGFLTIHLDEGAELCLKMSATADLRVRQAPSNHEHRVQEDEDAQWLKAS